MTVDAKHADDARRLAMGALRDVWDPELGLDVVSLGLVYDIRIERSAINIDMTLTTPGCPVSESLSAEAEAALRRAPPGFDVTERVGLGSALEPRADVERRARGGRVSAPVSDASRAGNDAH
jgi:metal-sulfur cluster biosynthetic enzyme